MATAILGNVRERCELAKALVLNRSYWPDAEATGQLLTELCEALCSEFDITVIAGQPNQNPEGVSCASWGREEHAGVSILRIPHSSFGKRSLWGRACNLLTYLAAATVTSLCVSRPDVVVVETDPFFLPLLGRLLKWRHRCRLVVYLQDIYPDVAVALNKIRKSWFTQLLRRRLFAAYMQADCIIVLGHDMREVLLKSGIAPDRIICIPNWADTDRIFPVRSENSFRTRYELNDRFVVMYSGNMGLCQNLPEILDAAELLKDHEQILFALVGDGASRSQLESSARARGLSNVRFFPYQRLAELAHSLSAANLHLVPLDPRVTGLLVPSKLYGILAAGVPALVIASAESEAARVVQEARVGKVVAPGNVAELVETILWCAEHRLELSEMGARARELAVHAYDRKSVTAQIAALLRHVLGAKERIL